MTRDPDLEQEAYQRELDTFFVATGKGNSRVQVFKSFIYRLCHRFAKIPSSKKVVIGADIARFPGNS